MPDDRYSDDAPESPRYDDEPPGRRYDDLDVSRPRSSELSWIDKQFRDTPLVLLIIFSCCCNGIALAFGLVGVIACKDPDARQKALIVTIISGLLVGAGTLVRIMSAAGKIGTKGSRSC